MVIPTIPHLLCWTLLSLLVCRSFLTSSLSATMLIPISSSSLLPLLGTVHVRPWSHLIPCPSWLNNMWDHLSEPLWQQFMDGAIAPAARVLGDAWGYISDEFFRPDTPGKSPSEEQRPQTIPGKQFDWVSPPDPTSSQIAVDCSSNIGKWWQSPKRVWLKKIMYALECTEISQKASISSARKCVSLRFLVYPLSSL